MPIILRCENCKEETMDGSLIAPGWIKLPRTGGDKVFCPKCREITPPPDDEELRHDPMNPLARMLTERREEVLMACGQRLLRLFRKQQKARGNVGCACLACPACQIDMVAALKEFAAPKKTDPPVHYITRPIKPASIGPSPMPKKAQDFISKAIVPVKPLNAEIDQK